MGDHMKTPLTTKATLVMVWLGWVTIWNHRALQLWLHHSDQSQFITISFQTNEPMIVL